jgi:alanyl-tRNA synthetase|uniref:alanine--tRNA ligase n=1 Tax=Cephaloticoccus sp. TaxID=1985742 RepID=UPI004049982D
MTSAAIRQSFLNFFAQQGHTVVPSASLLPDSPGLLFTNAGMNQFVPIFLGDKQPDVSKWAGAKANKDTRAADTQKCIRAGGKHNDLEDVGFDTYHHTFFEMLGNWSFGDYFKKESINWGWELITKIWGIPPKRLFATVYKPDASKGDPSEFDQEAYDIWADIFTKAGLDPAVHIVNGNKKDNFWMMGDTGPCGPCSEIHFNLLPSDDETAGRKLVNDSSPRCIEIWNHVFIQFNANADGTYSPLAAKHVDTGMGFDRVAGIYASTKGFTDFTAEPSNYNSDHFASLLAKISELSGKTYAATVPTKREGLTEQENTDVAFRVLADHARCVSCAIADGIMPGNEGRNYVIRRILRRGILYGTKLGLKTGFFEQLVTPVVDSLGTIFPELIQQQEIIRRVIRSEEESFGRTLGKGLGQLQLALEQQPKSKIITGKLAFLLYDTFGFPLDMTQLLATERGMAVDIVGFETAMDAQRNRGRASHKKEILIAATDGDASDFKATKFLGYTATNAHAEFVEIIHTDKDTFLVFDQTPFYAEMGGQAGDAGTAEIGGNLVHIVDTMKDKAGRFLHKTGNNDQLSNLSVGSKAVLTVDVFRRRAISRHHSAAHLIHWALRKVLGTHVRQAGTSKTPDRMRFDFSHFEAVAPAQLQEIEQLINEKVIDNSKVESYETEFEQKPADTLAFFGDKYGNIVRVVDIGGYSRELCGGTHVSTTGEIGLIKIVAEMAIAAGTRRIEAVAGQAAYEYITDHETALKTMGAKLNAGPQDIVQKLDTLLAHQKEIESKLKAFTQKASAGLSDELIATAIEKDRLKFITAVVEVESPEALRNLGSQTFSKLGEGVVRLGAIFGDKATVVAFCSKSAIEAGHQAGKIIASISTAIGGKGGGKPDFAMGGGKDITLLQSALTKG